MKQLLPLLLICISSSPVLSQNIDYQSRITRFYGSNCGGEAGNEEHTWKGWLSDNVNTSETYSGCITRDHNGAITHYGTWATRNRYNVTATQIRTRIDSWEDDNGGRCDYRTGTFINNDDCRANQTCTYNFTNPLEYQWTSANQTCGSSDYNMNTFYQYRYASTSIPNAVENSSQTFTTGGNRPFWGSRGSWSQIGGDCATSGTITNNQTSSFSTTVSCMSQVVFRWRVSSEANYDWLEVYVNGTRRARISGNLNWASRTINLDFGANTVEWRYVKDGSVSSFEDRGYVDEVRFVSATTLNQGAIAGNHTICSGGNPNLLTSTAAAQVYSTSPIYQWQYSNNNSTWSNISGANALTYDPPAGLSQTRYYRRRIQDGCGNTGYSNTLTVSTNPLPNGHLNSPSPICQGNSTNITFNATAGTGPWDIVYNGTTINNIATGTNIPVNPSSTTTYTLSSITDNNGCVRTVGLGAPATVTVNTNSSRPTIASVSSKQCPNSTVTLTASGGTAGTGSSIRWYSGANGTGSNLGTGSSINVSPTTATTYYARREGVCNTTNDDSEVIEVKDYAYTPTGFVTSSNYCTDNNNWHHFYNANDEIIFSMRGDLSGATSSPTISINNNGSFYQTTVGAAGSCTNGWSQGEELFELPRSWNVDFTGTLNPPYTIRYYFPASEKTALETAAANHITANAACNYTYKYSTPNGFYWFKNVGTSYAAPLYDQPTKLSGTTGTISGLHYSEITGITSFSGGSGGISLSPDAGLPVELTSFKGWNNQTTNVLQWITESELNNERFEIERSINPQDGFTTIATVNGAGNSTAPLTYLYEDATPMLGVNYYRLRQVDFDGTFTYSKIIAIEVEGLEGAQLFFPNPTQELVNYQFNSTTQETLTIHIVDILGKTLKEITYETNLGINTAKLDFESYSAGTYLVKVQNQEGELIATQQIIKTIE
ncbi:T9SS type A sorting domain-containing protein [Aureispira anguillae]|uniref:T9SS type A sorting domain-containing protein n=1 Tax=Aureispira anguillae TaxID=2864201 RepID=A0A916DTL1_9BACT|nr:T9SS type A sorting domain-containing protein [Aureispira anguillae]BDS12636.1 T9SS type A sorting domain-containing protein [Aureispira anguillae]